MKPPHLWIQEALEFLVRNQVAESLTYEYKETLDLDTASQKKEICKDVSAFANSQGGLIIYGLKEHDDKANGSIPSALVPIVGANLRERLEQVISNGIAPRLECRIYSIASSAGSGEFIVVHVPPSRIGVHMVVLGGENRFYVRREFSCVPMTVFEVESIFKRFARMDISARERLGRYLSPVPSKLRADTIWFSVVAVPAFETVDLFQELCYDDPSEIRTISRGLIRIDEM